MGERGEEKEERRKREEKKGRGSHVMPPSPYLFFFFISLFLFLSLRFLYNNTLSVLIMVRFSGWEKKSAWFYSVPKIWLLTSGVMERFSARVTFRPKISTLPTHPPT